jgi:hypothetical protein
MFDVIAAHCSVKLRSSQHGFAQFRSMQTAFVYSLNAVQPIRVNETRNTSGRLKNRFRLERDAINVFFFVNF